MAARFTMSRDRLAELRVKNLSFFFLVIILPNIKLYFRVQIMRKDTGKVVCYYCSPLI